MKIFFIGNLRSSYLTLQKLIANNAMVVSVVINGAFPFNSDYRGASGGIIYAEAFQLMKFIDK